MGNWSLEVQVNYFFYDLSVKTIVLGRVPFSDAPKIQVFTVEPMLNLGTSKERRFGEIHLRGFSVGQIFGLLGYPRNLVNG